MEESKVSQKAIKLSPLIEDYSKGDYFISSCNREAYEAIFSRPLGVLPFLRCMMILGGKFSGKTSLIHQSIKTCDSRFVSSPDDFAEKYHEIYIIDDCHNWNEADLFHAINICTENQLNLLISSDIGWQAKLPDLKSRINAIKQVRIYEPDDEMLEVIIASEFSKRSLLMSKDIMSYLKTRLPRNYEAIKNAILNIDEFCLEKKKNLTVKTLHSFFLSQFDDSVNKA